MNQYLEVKQEEFNKAIGFFKKEISQLRTGRANSSILDSVQVDSYGVKTSLSSVATINIPDGQSIVISPWDKNTLKDIEKAITETNLGVGVVNEGDKIRLTIPKMTEENRKELVKRLNEKMEAARVSIRQAREEVKNNIEQAHKDKEIAEDDKFRFVKEMDEAVGKWNDGLKEIRDKKEQEIMTI